MADIRQSAIILDDFERPDENPLSGGGDWAKTDTIWSDLRLVSGNVIPHLAGDSGYYWTPESFSGDDAEVWGLTHSVMDVSEGFRLGLFQDVGGSSAIDGYLLLVWNPIGGGGTDEWDIRRYANGGFIEIGTNTAGQQVGDNVYVMFRRNGSSLEGWFSLDSITWVLQVSVVDTTYTTDLFMNIGISSDDGSGPGWKAFGGGPRKFIPQIYRRPNE